MEMPHIHLHSCIRFFLHKYQRMDYNEKDISKGLHLLNVHILLKKCGNINNNFYLAPKYYGAKWHPFLILCLIKLIF
jgi:hypothetical protein